MFVLQTLVLYECEKHPREEDWEEVRYIFMVMSLVVRVAVVVVKLLVTTMVMLSMVVMVKLVAIVMVTLLVMVMVTMLILRHTSETELVGS